MMRRAATEELAERLPHGLGQAVMLGDREVADGDARRVHPATRAARADHGNPLAHAVLEQMAFRTHAVYRVNHMVEIHKGERANA